MHKLALQSLFVDVLGNNLADIVLPRACPAVQGESKRLLGIGVVLEPDHCLQDHFFGKVLAEEFRIQNLLQG